MPLKLPLKKKLSNQPGTPSKIATLSPTPTISHPFIDKISVIVGVDDDDQGPFFTALYGCLDDTDLFTSYGAGRIGGFQLSRRLKLPSIADFVKLPSVHFGVDKANKRLEKVRFEFVPVDLGSDGMIELHSAVCTFMEDGWNYAVANGYVTRIDVAVDLGVATDVFLFLPKLATGTMQWRLNGRLESVYFGKPKGNQTKVYDRQAKRVAKGQHFPDVSTRIERKLVNLKGRRLFDLGMLPNPFSEMKLIPNPVTPPPWLSSYKVWEWTLFCDAVKVRGLSDALAILPEDKRSKYRAYLKTQNLDWWEPKNLWKGWSAMLNELKISSGKF